MPLLQPQPLADIAGKNVGKKAASKKLLAKYTGKYGWQKNPLAIIYWQKSTLANTYWQIYTSIFLAGILVLAKKSTSKKVLAKAASKYRHWRKCPETENLPFLKKLFYSHSVEFI